MVTEEELSQMSPEEVNELQKKNCVFCQIASGAVPAKEVYSDDKSVAVLDINPATEGHMLLMPKDHFSIMPQIPKDLIEHLFIVAKHLSQAVLKGLKSKGITVFVANGAAAGQRAPHFMVHLIPRDDDDGLQLNVPAGKFSEGEVGVVAKNLRKALGMKVDADVVKEEKAEKKKAPKKKTGPKKKAESKKKKSDGQAKKGAVKKFDLDAVTDLFAGGKSG